jgi:short-subunit dehydrogenase
MAERGRGAVLITASTAGFQPLPGNAGYSAAKAHALTFAASLHGELRGAGIAVTALAPGPVETEFTATDPDFPGFRVFPKPLWQTPRRVARLAVEGLDRNRLNVVPGVFFKVGQVAAAVSPPSVATRVFSTVWMRRR